MQELDVTPRWQSRAAAGREQNGAVPNAYCASATSNILHRLPGLDSIRPGMFPVKLADQFRSIPGVRRSVLHEYDDDDNSKLLEQWDAERFARVKAEKKKN
ncbi:MAG: hypothetical protein R3D85_03685 [Paracoccaceae bacterium]